MSSSPAKVLVVVEGKRLEHDFFEQIKKVYGLNIDIYCFESNIYLLYKKMKEMNFNGNLKDVLKTIHNNPESNSLLSQNFAYTYLIFDFDAHHTEEYEKDRPLINVIKDNIEKIKEMANYFVDETDPTIGKLYVNYPMMESFKDCDSFDDKTYLNRCIAVDEIKQYKTIVSTRKMANKRVDSYTSIDLEKLSKLNVIKMTSILLKKYKVIDYNSYLNYSNQYNILLEESDYITNQDKIAVLNTCIFFLLDYYGNKNGFYDKIMNDNKS